MQDPNKIRAWHLSQTIAVRVIHALAPQRMRRVPGLRSQAVRAATSVSSNIVEGCSRSSRPELHSYIERAVGSLNELENHLNTIASAGAMRPEAHRTIVADIGMARGMLISFSRTVLRRIAEDEQAERSARERKKKKARAHTPDAVDGSNAGA